LGLIKGEEMEFEEFKAGISKPNIITIILMALFVLILLLGHEHISALIYPAPLNQYKEILGNKTESLREQKLGTGHIINFEYKENRKSLGELYSLTDVKFIPENKNLPIWKGEDKIEIWNNDTALIENMQRFRIKFTIPVPDDETIQEHTIKGTLNLKLSYPILIQFTEKKLTTHSETWEKPISIHIFSKYELNKLSELKSQMVKIWLSCLALFFFPILAIFANHMHKYKKAHPSKIE